MAILSANVRGFQTNLGDLTHNFILRNKIDFAVAVETFLNEETEQTYGKIPGYCHWIRRDRQGRHGGGLAVCYRENMQVEELQIDLPREIEILFFRIEMADRTSLLLCAMYRPQWQGSMPIEYLTNHLDEISERYNCHNTIIVGDLNQHQVKQAFNELTAVHGLNNFVDFSNL